MRIIIGTFSQVYYAVTIISLLPNQLLESFGIRACYTLSFE